MANNYDNTISTLVLSGYSLYPVAKVLGFNSYIKTAQAAVDQGKNVREISFVGNIFEFIAGIDNKKSKFRKLADKLPYQQDYYQNRIPIAQGLRNINKTKAFIHIPIGIILGLIIYFVNSCSKQQ